jgi:hypothetical protein
MRALQWSEIEDILLGATILGCGGGGELEEGRSLLRKAYLAGRQVKLSAPEDLADDAMLACPYGVGALTVGDAGFYQGRSLTDEHPAVLALRALATYCGCEFSALVCGELGGTSISDAFYPAAMLGLPVVDADAAARAVPELQHSLFCVRGLPIAPQAVVNEIGDTAIITEVADDRRSEALVRALAVASRSLVWVADHARPWSELRAALVPDTISLSQQVGRACREACAEGTDAAQAVADAAGGGLLFRGTVSSCAWRDSDGFTVGETALDGVEAFDASRYRIFFKNENLAAWRDEVPDVTCPDLICVLDEASGQPVTNPNVEEGSRLAIIGVPAPAAWRIPEGLATFGPRSVGLDVDYAPLEDRLGSRA